MAQATSKVRAMRKKRWAVMLGIVLLLMIALLGWLTQNRIGRTPSVPGVQPQREAAAPEDGAQPNPPEAKFTDAQIEQATNDALAQLAEAAKAVPAAKPVEGPVTRRPDFVSEFEWEMLQEAAGRKPDRDAEMTLMVNKLLFFKKYEMWRSMSADSRDVTARHALANEILDLIPGMMPVLGPEQSEEMKSALLADLNRS